VRDPQLLGNSAGLDVALGDLDRDGDTDAFVANGRLLVGEASEIWRNGQQAGDTFPYDGVVDLSDLNRVRNNFGASGIAVEGDGNGDGQVDLTDLNLVRNNFGAGSSPNQSNIPPGVPAVHLPKPPYAAVDALFYQLATNDRMNKNPLNRLTTNRGVALQRHELR
jgi:hypothetical protein